VRTPKTALPGLITAAALLVLAAVTPLQAGTIMVPPSSPTSIELRCVEKEVLGEETLVRQEFFRCRDDPGKMFRQAVHVVTADVSSADFFGADEIPSNPALNAQFEATLLVRQRTAPDDRACCGSFEGPWRIVWNGTEVARGRMHGTLIDDALFDGFLTGTADFGPAWGNNRQFRASIFLGFGLDKGDVGTTVPFEMLISGVVEVNCVDAPFEPMMDGCG
jgi:hypothetical protein